MLCRDIVSGAMRKIGKLGAGREPRLADQTDVLAALQSMYRQLITQGSFGCLTDVMPIGTTYTARENERVFRNSDATLSVTLPEAVATWTAPRSYADETDNYENIDGNMRPPRDCAVVVISDAFTAQTIEYIYDGHGKLWQAIDALTLDSEAPLSRRDPEGLKSYLAGQIVDEFGGQMGPATMAQAANFISGLTHRYSMPREAASGVYC